MVTGGVSARPGPLGGRPEVPPRSRTWAQLVLAGPVLARRGDRFILRDETARLTLGGGIVANPFAARHRAAEGDPRPHLERLLGADPADVAAAFLDLDPGFASDRATIVQALNLRDEEAVPALARLPEV